MSDFPEFYQQGGVFMHLITLLTLASAGLLAKEALGIRGLVRRVTAGKPPPAATEDRLTLAFIIGALMFGLLGATFGIIETCAALRTVPPEHHTLALMRAIPIALSPLAWSLLLAAPLVIGRAVVGTVDARLRALAARA